MKETGLRERKKAATRRALQQAALRLFEKNGYQETTVRDIAAAAGVTERTFFRYFPSKEDMIYGEVVDLLPDLQRNIRERPAGETPLTAVLNGFLAVGAARDFALAILFSGPPARLSPAPSRRTGPILFDFETGVAEAIADRLARHDGDQAGPERLRLRSAVLARAAVGAVRSALTVHGEAGGPPVPDEMVRLLREAFAVLRDET